mmetsp:Transcript_36237/g.80639  ORF Transcript_36237/g.80639 Transcript_36237/m.80639 type:complete len:122 (+) Transcript_36237:245-610(+)
MATCVPAYSQTLFSSSHLQPPQQSAPSCGDYYTAYLVVIIRYGASFNAIVPDVPGCVAAASDLPTVRGLISDGLALHLESIIEDREPLPAPKTEQYDQQLGPGEEVVEEACIRMLVEWKQC